VQSFWWYKMDITWHNPVCSGHYCLMWYVDRGYRGKLQAWQDLLLGTSNRTWLISQPKKENDHHLIARTMSHRERKYLIKRSHESWLSNTVPSLAYSSLVSKSSMWYHYCFPNLGFYLWLAFFVMMALQFWSLANWVALLDSIRTTSAKIQLVGENT
jgi:hypothetical protein